MTRLPSVLLPGHLSLPGHLPLAELCAARLDGELRAVDEGFVVSDLPTGRAERGAALLAVLPRGTVADRMSAAWVHGACADPPAVHSASIDRRHRLHPPRMARLRFHEVRLTDSEIVVMGGCAVTTPIRTLVDLARVASACGDDVLRSLAEVTGTSLDDVLAHLAEAGTAVAGRRIAESRLAAALSAQPPSP